MLQLSIALLFVVTAVLSLAVVAGSLRRAWLAAGELRQALRRCDEQQAFAVRIVDVRRPATLRLVTSAATTRRTVPAPCALPVAA